MRLNLLVHRAGGRLALLLVAALFVIAASGWQLRLLSVGPRGTAPSGAAATVTALAVDTADGSLL